MSLRKSTPPSLWNTVNSSLSYPAAEKKAWKIRRNKYRLYIYIGMEFMFNNERVVWVYMCLGGMSVECVGLVHLQNTQDSHIQSTCYYSNSLKPQITFHRAQRMAVCNHRDRRKSSDTFIVTPRGIFLHVILDHLLKFSFYPHSPNLMPPAQCLTTPPKSPLSPPPRCCLLCWVNKAEPSSAWLSWRLVTERWMSDLRFQVSSFHS